MTPMSAKVFLEPSSRGGSCTCSWSDTSSSSLDSACDDLSVGKGKGAVFLVWDGMTRSLCFDRRWSGVRASPLSLRFFEAGIFGQCEVCDECCVSWDMVDMCRYNCGAPR